jgi:hypothetical protein
VVMLELYTCIIARRFQDSPISSQTQPLWKPDRGCSPRRHDAACTRRSAEHRRRAQLGTELLPPAATLRGPGQSSLHLHAPVEVEAVVNGLPVSSQKITAAGVFREITLEVAIAGGSWVALRIRGSAHTNPIFVIVGGRPIRASRRSVQWCLAGVDRCWSQKAPRIRARERDAASRAYEHARSSIRRSWRSPTSTESWAPPSG